MCMHLCVEFSYMAQNLLDRVYEQQKLQFMDHYPSKGN